MQPTAVNGGQLQTELQATRESFRELTRALPDTVWSNRAPGSKWTGRQLLHHVTWALEQLPKELEAASKEKGMFNYPKFIADPGSYWLVKWEARGQTRESLVARYEAAMDRTLEALPSIPPGGWGKGARFYGERFYLVEDLFHTPANHFQEHAAILTRFRDD
ncbi:hypothetical protein AYO38_03485 [bacterium SCGC AG-212-C10]|nr:hypothetical protein AYO38_03485 [bacterium SCGC AG-212-C10]